MHAARDVIAEAGMTDFFKAIKVDLDGGPQYAIDIKAGVADAPTILPCDGKIFVSPEIDPTKKPVDFIWSALDINGHIARKHLTRLMREVIGINPHTVQTQTYRFFKTEGNRELWSKIDAATRAGASLPGGTISPEHTFAELEALEKAKAAARARVEAEQAEAKRIADETKAAIAAEADRQAKAEAKAAAKAAKAKAPEPAKVDEPANDPGEVETGDKAATA
jgi:hypothetical protein